MNKTRSSCTLYQLSIFFLLSRISALAMKGREAPPKPGRKTGNCRAPDGVLVEAFIFDHQVAPR